MKTIMIPRWIPIVLGSLIMLPIIIGVASNLSISTKEPVQRIVGAEQTPPNPTPAQTNSSGLQNISMPTTISSQSAETVSANNLAKYQGEEYVREVFVGNGSTKTLLLQHSYDDITIRLDGSIITLGTYRGEGMPCGGNEACYDFSGKKLVFRRAPPRSAQITVVGFPQ